MKKGTLKSIFCLVLCGLLLGSSITVRAEEKITPSTKNWGLELQGAKNLYLCNEKPVDLNIGTKFFITYTVTEMQSDLSVQSGVIITPNANQDFPYEGGTMKYLNSSALLDKGWTYFYRFEMTEEGLVCLASRAKGDTSEYIGLSMSLGEVKDGCKYFGVWFGGTKDTNMVGRLTRIRCYDEKGKDLGIDFTGHTAKASIYDPDERQALQPNEKIKNKYTITLNENFNTAISNREYTESDVVYMEYTVKSVTSDKLTRNGTICTYEPTSIWPMGSWAYEDHNMETYKGCHLLIPGVTYMIRYKIVGDKLNTLIKYKVNGEWVYYEYSQTSGTVGPGCGFYCLWLGEGKEATATAELVDFKCYDKNGKNLGVRTNNSAVVKHQGGLEDYSKCLAAYYNIDKDSTIWLQEEQVASVVTGDDVATGNYVIDGTKLTITIGGNAQEYYYVYNHIKDSEGNKYIRLKDNTVSFVSGIVSGKEIEKIKVTADTGYKVEEPETPVMKENTFVAWCYADGTEFDFDSIITESITLYAKWMDGDGNTFLAVDAKNEQVDKIGLIVGNVSLLLLTATVAGCILITKHKSKREKGGGVIEP